MKKATRTFNEENIKYLREFLGNDEVDTFFRVHKLNSTKMKKLLQTNPEEYKTHDKVEKCLEQMEKSGDNRWWTSKDKRVLGYYQLMNPIILVSFKKYHNALKFLLGRPVWEYEIALNYDELKEEAERAFKGTQDSEEQKAESIKKFFEQLANLEKPVIGVVVG